MTRRQVNGLGMAFGAVIGFFATAGTWQIVSSVMARSETQVAPTPVVIPVMEALRLHVDPPAAPTVEALPYSGPTIEPEPAPPVVMRRPHPPRRPTVVVEPAVTEGNNGAPILD